MLPSIIVRTKNRAPYCMARAFPCCPNCIIIASFPKIFWRSKRVSTKTFGRTTSTVPMCGHSSMVHWHHRDLVPIARCRDKHPLCNVLRQPIPKPIIPSLCVCFRLLLECAQCLFTVGLQPLAINPTYCACRKRNACVQLSSSTFHT